MKAVLTFATCLFTSLLLLPVVSAEKSVVLMLDDNMTVFVRDSYLNYKEMRGNIYWANQLAEHLEHVKERFHIDKIKPLTKPNQILVTFHHDKDEENNFKSPEDQKYHAELQANLA